MSAALAPARRPDQNDDRQHEGGTMSFLEHLEDLRKRIIHSCIALAVGMAISVAFVERLAVFVFEPTWRALPPGAELISSRPTEGFAVYFDIALMAGLIIAAPFIMYQVWLFIVPALYAHEKKFVVPFIVLASIGSVAGAAFSHYVLFPSMMSFFATFTFAGIRFVPRVEYVFEMYVRSLIGMVAVFQIPTLALFLAKMRLVTARFLWNHIRYAVLLILIAAAVLTPSPDPWNMAVFAAPMLCLYVIGIAVAWLAEPKRRANDAGLRLVFTAAVLDQAWKQRSARPSGRL